MPVITADVYGIPVERYPLQVAAAYSVRATVGVIVSSLWSLNFFFPFLGSCFPASLSEKILHAGQTTGNEGKARKPPGIERNTQPDGTVRKRTGRRTSIWRGRRSIYKPFNGAMFDDRNDVVHSHGKIAPEGSAAERQGERIKENIPGDCKRKHNQRNYPQNPQSVSARSHTPWIIHTPSVSAGDSRK